jgi:hypothetical protein
VKYRPGAEMILADTLSRSPNPKNDLEVDLDLRVDELDVTLEESQDKIIALINFPPDKQKLLREETVNDSVLNALKEIVHTGWPDSIKDLPSDLRAYWSFREQLAVESGVLFKGRQVLIPISMQEDILHKLHQGYQGIEKTRKLACDTVYWVNINKHIESLC